AQAAEGVHHPLQGERPPNLRRGPRPTQHMDLVTVLLRVDRGQQLRRLGPLRGVVTGVSTDPHPPVRGATPGPLPCGQVDDVDPILLGEPYITELFGVMLQQSFSYHRAEGSPFDLFLPTGQGLADPIDVP